MIIRSSVLGSRLSIWRKGQKCEPRRGWLARCWLFGTSLCLMTFLPITKANSEIIYKSNLKQYTFFKLDYSFEQFYCVDELWFMESRWDHKAKNPKSSAFGIPQILGLKEKNPYKQIDRGLAYIKHRHKNPCQALTFHKKNGWY
jgi:hypothetical protein